MTDTTDAARSHTLDDAGDELSPADPRHGRVTQRLMVEADLLDEYRFEEWLALCADDIDYRMPTRTTRFLRDGDGFEDMAFFVENYASLDTRVKRLQTDFAWAEAPPSRTRHFVSNVRVFETPTEGEFLVRSSLLLTRTRSDLGYQMYTAARRDLWRDHAGDLKLARRRILLDQTALTGTNLSVFF